MNKTIRFLLSCMTEVMLLNDYVRSQTPYIDLIEKWYPGEYQKSTFSGRRIDFCHPSDHYPIAFTMEF